MNTITIIDESRGYISGYAAPFNEMADDGRRGFIRGAFARSIREVAATAIKVPLAYDHCTNVGTVLTMVEDERGLLITGKVAIETPFGKALFKLVRDNVVNGLSVRIHARDWNEDRFIVDCDLYEISLGVVGAFGNARVSAYDAYDHRITRRWRDAWKGENA